ncbi:MAG TPA: redoxin domain-containing protein [Planctomycetota bacterium]|nr:redoxin domain-containing protein [Planctomycetota bacterium]
MGAVPHLLELAAKHKDQGLVVIGVHTTDKGDKMAAFVADQKITYPVAIDVENKTTSTFAVDSYPDYYLIDRRGFLRVADLLNAHVDAAIATLLAEPVPAAAKPKIQELDAQKGLDQAIADAKQSERNVLVHVHGPG